MADGAATVPADPLAGLITAPLPPSISMWPQTWGARLVIVLVAVLLIAGLWYVIRRYRADAYRRAASRELTAIAQEAASGLRSVDTIEAVALLVRRTALVAFPRREIAMLSGPGWLAFLDDSFAGEGFVAGPGTVVSIAPYDPRSVVANDVAPLIALVRRWIWAHHD